MPKWVTKMPKWAIKVLNLAKCSSIFVAKKWHFKYQNIFFGGFPPTKRCWHYGFYEVDHCVQQFSLTTCFQRFEKGLDVLHTRSL